MLIANKSLMSSNTGSDLAVDCFTGSSPVLVRSAIRRLLPVQPVIAAAVYHYVDLSNSKR